MSARETLPLVNKHATDHQRSWSGCLWPRHLTRLSDRNLREDGSGERWQNEAFSGWTEVDCAQVTENMSTALLLLSSCTR